MKSQIKRTIAILLLVCFVVSMTATAVSAKTSYVTVKKDAEKAAKDSLTGETKEAKEAAKTEKAVEKKTQPNPQMLFMDVSTWGPSNRDEII